MLVIEVVRRWWVPLLAAALLIAGVTLWQYADPSTASMPRRYAYYLEEDGSAPGGFVWQALAGSLLILAAIVLSLVWAVVSVRRREPGASGAPAGD